MNRPGLVSLTACESAHTVWVLRQYVNNGWLMIGIRHARDMERTKEHHGIHDSDAPCD